MEAETPGMAGQPTEGLGAAEAGGELEAGGAAEIQGAAGVVFAAAGCGQETEHARERKAVRKSFPDEVRLTRHTAKPGDRQ